MFSWKAESINKDPRHAKREERSDVEKVGRKEGRQTVPEQEPCGTDTPGLAMGQADCRGEAGEGRGGASVPGREEDDEGSSESVEVCRVDRVGRVLGWRCWRQRAQADGILVPTK